MRVFKTKGFSRFARKERLDNAKPATAVREIERGLHKEYQKAARVYMRLSDADMGKALEEIDYAEQEISQ
jgi:hypothetical protein